MTSTAPALNGRPAQQHALDLGEDHCPQCAPHACDDPDRHLGVPSEYTPLANRGCRCGADAGGWDCMCFE